MAQSWRKCVVLVCWTGSVLLLFSVLGHVLGGRFGEYWFSLAAIITCSFAIMVELSKHALHSSSPAKCCIGKTIFSGDVVAFKAATTVKESMIMFKEGGTVIHNPGVINIHNNNSQNTVQNGIIGSGTVNVHHHTGDRRPETAAAQDEPASRYVRPITQC